MLQLLINPIPNQSFSFNADNSYWQISILFTGTIYALSVTQDGNLLSSSFMLVANRLLITYDYLCSSNFILTTQNKEIADHTQFGITQQLYYVSPAEVNSLNGN